MEMTQPQSIPMPKDVQNAINDGRNQVTMLQAECDRLNGLITSYNYTIGQLHNQQKEAEAMIPGLQKQVDDLKMKIVALNGESKSLLDECKNLQQSKENLEKTIKEETITFQNKQNELQSNIAKYNEDKALLDTERALVESEAIELNKKIEALKGIVNG